jgi:hypothetical protein
MKALAAHVVLVIPLLLLAVPCQSLLAESSDWLLWEPSTAANVAAEAATLPSATATASAAHGAAARARSVRPGDSCELTFDDFDARVHREFAPYALPSGGSLSFATAAVLCPAGCVRGAASSLSARVYGSYPYHNASAVCAAAVHAGVIRDEDGGGVFVSRFFRQEWSGTATQTIFPFQSARGSLSNGVDSLPVPDSWFSSPADANSWSYVPRGRGDYIQQRRSAPFPPRAGHLQVGEWGFSFYPLENQFWLPRLQFTIGGWNGSHYLNDVWASFVLHEADDSGADVDWLRLADAPFSPRADMLWFPDHSDVQLDTEPSGVLNYSFYVLGGQVAHRCNAYEFGVCSNELWRGRVSLQAFDLPGGRRSVHLDWLPGDGGQGQPYTRMPFKARCGPSFYYNRFDIYWRQWYQPIALHGGQASYESETCEALPQYPLDSWTFSPDNATNPWTRGNDINYPPRRSSWSEAGTLGWMGENRGVVGGWRMLGHRYEPSKNTATMTKAELYADVWNCDLDLSLDANKKLHKNHSNCFFGFPTTNGTSAPYVPSGSIPLPMSGLRLTDGAQHKVTSVRFGGWTSEAAVQQWRDTRPDVHLRRAINWAALQVNMSAVVRRLPVYMWEQGGWSELLVSAASLDADRLGLSLSYTVEEAELRDGSYTYGRLDGRPAGAQAVITSIRLHR